MPREEDPFPVEGLFEGLTSVGMTRELIATAAAQSRAIHRVLDAVRFGTATLPATLLEELERLAATPPIPAMN